MERKDLKKYVDMPHRIEIKPDKDGGFFVSIPDLSGCYSQAESIPEAYDMILDAKKAWIETALEDGENIPEPLDEKSYSGRVLLRIPPDLHADLAQKAALQGSSLNQYLTYLLARENEKQKITFEHHVYKTNIIDKIDVRVETHPQKEEEYDALPNNRIKNAG